MAEPSASFWYTLCRWLGIPAPHGRWVEGGARSARGMLAIAPLVPARREYRLYVPRGYSRWRRSAMIVLCHGCRQTPEAFAQGTRIAAVADARRWLVLTPRQRNDANAWSCWNWFDPATERGAGEAAIVAKMAARLARRFRADRGRVFVAGLSAGGALAAVLGVRHPDVFCGVVVHSGLACGAAGSPLGATTAMARGPQADVTATGRAAHRDGLRVPLLAIHGMADDVVAPRNATAVVRQFLALNGFDIDDDELPVASVDSDVPAHDAGDAPVHDAGDAPAHDAGDARAQHADREALAIAQHPMRERDWRDAQGLVARLVEIGGLAHAWSGGDATLPYNDATAPDAWVLIAQWIADVGTGSRRMQNLAGDRR